LRISHNYYETGKPARHDEMAYMTFILMASAMEFRGEIQEAFDTIVQAEAFAPERNEHLLYWALMLENQERYDEVLRLIDLMMLPEKKNPFPQLCFLIENRAYTDTSNFLAEWKEKIMRRINEPVLSNQGVDFDFE
jgi:hypothetical protein